MQDSRPIAMDLLTFCKVVLGNQASVSGNVRESHGISQEELLNWATIR